MLADYPAVCEINVQLPILVVARLDTGTILLSIRTAARRFCVVQ
jgi:hypothetical protein